MDTKIKEVSLKKRLVTLFFSMLSISAFTFGGGFVIVTLMKRRFVDDLHWLDEDEMLDMTAIAQSCPGAIAVNGAILVGQRVAGAAGIVVATIATDRRWSFCRSSRIFTRCLPITVCRGGTAGMQAGVAAVIVDVVLNLGAGVLKARRWLLNVIMVVAFVAAISGVNVIYIILTSGVIGVICAVMGRGKKAHAA
ncbi:MAG: chromate transporter [Christensenellales bacterium]